MRWQHVRPTPVYVGDRRQVTKFLWLPRCINYETRWLEWATFEQWYVVEDRGWDGVVSCWKDKRWVDL